MLREAQSHTLRHLDKTRRAVFGTGNFRRIQGLRSERTDASVEASVNQVVVHAAFYVSASMIVCPKVWIITKNRSRSDKRAKKGAREREREREQWGKPICVEITRRRSHHSTSRSETRHFDSRKCLDIQCHPQGNKERHRKDPSIVGRLPNQDRTHCMYQGKIRLTLGYP